MELEWGIVEMLARCGRKTWREEKTWKTKA